MKKVMAFLLALVLLMGTAAVAEDTESMNDHMNGEFPVLKPGANAISWTGTVTKVVVKPNWRYL